jgi:hypothetical protein
MTNNEMMETAMQEILEEQKEINKTNLQLIGKIEYLSSQVTIISKQQINKEATIKTDEKVLLEIESELENIKQLIAVQPKNIIHQKRFLLFPEQNAKEYYSTVLRWIFYIIIASYSYSLVRYIIDHWRNNSY